MRKYRRLVALGGLLTLLACGEMTVSLFGCSSTVDLGSVVGTDDNTPTDDPDVGGEDGTANDAGGSGGEGAAGEETASDDQGTTDAGTEEPDDDDTEETGTVGDATCLAVTSAESESSVQCATGPCGEVQWQNDCGESVVVVMLDADRERILQILGITSGGIGTAFVDPDDWSADMAYGVVVGTDNIECGSEADCSVSDLVERELLDPDHLVAIAVN